MKRIFLSVVIALVLVGICGCRVGSYTSSLEIVNVSYDPTREFYSSYNELFKSYWKNETGEEIDIIQSHGGSGKQALEVANGLEADVVTLALEGDVNAVKDAGLINEGYTSEFPLDSAPYTSSIVFLVREGNPKDINDWNDLLREDVDVITPNPSTSGGARWNYLAAWYYFEEQGQSESQIIESMKTLYKNVLVMDSGARGSATTFTENGQGDVLIAWENEAFLSLKEYSSDYDIIIPSVSILCQPTTAVVDDVVDERGSRKISEAYISYLYSNEAQQLVAKNFYRPVDKEVLKDYIKNSSNTIKVIPEDGKWLNTSLKLTDIKHFGGWDEVIKKHFSDNGIFNQIYEK
ncbi:Sulfate and thiosulfate binding protein CysP [Lachnospiraceae bacterium TWA4]|nr:Sulfate and thiosulfate binding protein CysP [Lachnospiraceae bacterium TWA4]